MPSGRTLSAHRRLAVPDEWAHDPDFYRSDDSALALDGPRAGDSSSHGLRSMGAARATSQIKMHKTERTAAGFYHRMQEEYTKPAYSRRTPIKPVQLIKQHMSWEEKAGKTPL